MSCENTYNICLIDSETYKKTWFYKDSDGNAIDITGYSMKMEVLDTQNDVVVATLSSDNVAGDRIEITGVDGKWIEYLDISSFSTSIRYKYDLLVTDTTGFRSVFRSGFIIIKEGVTDIV